MPSPFPSQGPRRVWYLVGGLLAAAGVIAGIAAIVDAVRDDGFAVVPIHGRVPVPGDGVVSVPESGGYTLYWEPDDAAEGDIVAPRLELFVQEAGSGDPLPTADYDSSFTYTRGGRRGVAVRTFRANDARRVLVTAVGPPGVTGAIAVGEGLDLSEVGQIVRGLAAALFGLAIGGVVIGVTAYRRHRARHPAARVPGRWPTPPAAPRPPPPPPPPPPPRRA